MIIRDNYKRDSQNRFSFQKYDFGNKFFLLLMLYIQCMPLKAKLMTVGQQRHFEVMVD